MDKIAVPVTALKPSLKHGLLFGLLSMLGPFAIDFYLPAFAEISRDLNASAHAVQLSLGAFIAALAVGPMLFGTLSDRFGRRPVLFGALVLFGTSSVLCAVAPSVEILIAFRILQGLGACALTVISRAMVRDVARGDAAARLLALAFLVQSVSPLFAPVIGGALLSVVSWRILFAIIAAMALAVGLIVAWQLPETHGSERRTAPPQSALKTYGALLRQPRYMAMCVIAGCATAGGFGFLTAAPFIFAYHFGQNESFVGLLLAGVAVFQIVTTQLCPWMMRARGIDRHLTFATRAGLLLALTLAGVTAAGWLALPVLIVIVAMLFGVYGLLLTPAAVGALDAATGYGGAAAALFGTIQLSTAALASLLLSTSGSGSPVLFVSVTVATMVIAVGAARLAARHATGHPVTEPVIPSPFPIVGDRS